MAGDWIPVTIDLRDHRKVRRIANSLSLDKDTVVGKLIAVWGWFDRNSVDGVVDGLVEEDVDDIARHEGFANAMMDVEWLDVHYQEEWMRIPDFDIHNGNSAKKRLTKSESQRRWRGNKGAGNKESESTEVSTVVDVSASTEPTTTEQNITEQKSKRRAAAVPPPVLPEWLPKEAWDDWSAFRRTVRGWTPRAQELCLKTLSDLREKGHDPVIVINRSIECGWRGLFPVKEERKELYKKLSEDTKRYIAAKPVRRQSNEEISKSLGEHLPALFKQLGMVR